MKRTYFTNKNILLYLFIFSIHFIGYNQVGIGTTAPNGILDINSTTSGVVLPKVALAATNVALPVVNPHPTNTTIPTGTVVYNTNTTTSGSNSVYPGMYVWITDKWVPQFTLKQTELFAQVGSDFLTLSNAGYQTITLDGTTFTANYTGTYKVEVNVNYGGGVMRRPGRDGLNIASMTGTFRFRFNNGSDVDYFIPIKSNSSRFRSGGSYFAIWKQQSIEFYVTLDRNDTPTFSLAIDQADAPEFNNNGNSGSGRGNVGDDFPCTIEITYIGG